jgi:hypothetical protein
MDDMKHGPSTLMAPFSSWDPNVRNGDKLAGFAYPQLLPTKIESELSRRYEGKIIADKKLLKEWVQRKVAIEKQVRAAAS